MTHGSILLVDDEPKIRQALVQGSWFVFGIVLPSFVLLSVVTDRVARTRGRRPPGSDSA